MTRYKNTYIFITIILPLLIGLFCTVWEIEKPPFTEISIFLRKYVSYDIRWNITQFLIGIYNVYNPFGHIVFAFIFSAFLQLITLSAFLLKDLYKQYKKQNPA